MNPKSAFTDPCVYVYAAWSLQGGSVQRGDGHHQPLHWHDPITQENGRSLVE